MRPVLVLVEGVNDIHLLTRFARMLCRDQVTKVALDGLLNGKRVLFVPIGGGLLADWWNRFEPLQCPEFHLYDREIGPQSIERQSLIEKINARANCRAMLTAKRSLENYLHPRAIAAAGGCEIKFGNDDDVAEILVREWLKSTAHSTPWNQLSPRTQQRLRYRGKRWLNTTVADRMTAEWLAERDPDGEVRDWLEAIFSMIEPVD